MEHLLTQAHDKPIEILAYWNNGELPIGEIRQALLEEARGEYVCFIDDDDWVPDDYCDTILDNLGQDYVGFRVQLFNDGNEKPPVFHSLKYDSWYEAYDGYYRNITHLNPVRRSLALLGAFSGGAGEDAKWADQVKPYVKTENYIDRIMYHYYHDSMDTSFGSVDSQPDSNPYPRPVIKHKQFRYHPKSKETA